MMIMMIMLTITMTMMMINHPLLMGLMLFIQSMLVAMMSGMMSSNFWFSYILIMIMVGGMLIVFIYMTSIASNEKFDYKNKFLIPTLMTTMFYMSMNIYTKYFDYLIMNMEDGKEYLMMKEFSLSLNKFLNYPNNLLLMLIIIYLLITLISIVKIINIKEGPMRQK